MLLKRVTSLSHIKEILPVLVNMEQIKVGFSFLVILLIGAIG